MDIAERVIVQNVNCLSVKWRMQMNRLLTCFLIFVVTLHLIPENTDNPTDASLTGYTYAYRQGDTLSHVEIRLKSTDSQNEYKTYSDETGRYYFSNIIPKEYALKTALSGFVNYQQTLRFTNKENKFFNIGIKIGSLDGSLPEPYMIHGTVSQASGAALSEATVVIISPFDQEIASTALTDKQGKYYLKAMGNRFIIYAYKPGFEVMTERITLKGGWLKKWHQANFILNDIEYKSEKK